MILDLSNQKGGVGKTTLSVNMAGVFAEQGKTVLVIDVDPHAGATSYFGYDSSVLERTMTDVLNEQVALQDVILETKVKGLDVAPADKYLSDVEAAAIPAMMRGEEWRLRLKNAVDSVLSQYDIIILDSAPNLGVLSSSALITADCILIPVQCQQLSLPSLRSVVGTIKNLQLKTPYAVIRNAYDVRTNQSKEISAEFEKEVPSKYLLSTIIPHTSMLQDASGRHLPIVFDNYHAKASSAFRGLVKEVMDRYGNERAN